MKQEKRFELKMSDELFDKLDSIARELNISRASVVKMLISTYNKKSLHGVKKGGATTTPPLGVHCSMITDDKK